MSERHRRSDDIIDAPLLPERIARALANAPHARLVARAEAERWRALPEIASLHTRKELLSIEGLGPVAIRKLEHWLARHGRRLRHRAESLDTVICNFGFHANQRRRRSGDHSQRKLLAG